MKKTIHNVKNMFKISNLAREDDFKFYCQKRNLDIGRKSFFISIILQILFIIPFMFSYKFDFNIIITKFYFQMCLILIGLSIIGIILVNVSYKKMNRYDYRINKFINVFLFLFLIWGIGINRGDLIKGRTSIVYMQMLIYISVFFYIKFKNVFTIYFLTYIVYVIELVCINIEFSKIYLEIVVSFTVLIVSLFVAYTKYLVELRTHDDLKLIEEKNKKLNLANEKLQKLSMLDSLTNLYNKQKLKEICICEYKKAFINITEITYVMIDIDYYKIFNDTYGHIAGDKCLKMISDKLYSIISKYNGRIGRYGGEEFLAILTNINCSDIKCILKELVEEIEKLKIKNKKEKVCEYVTISIGAYQGIPANKGESSMFIYKADKALYKAKAEGKNRYVLLEKDQLNGNICKNKS